MEISNSDKGRGSKAITQHSPPMANFTSFWTLPSAALNILHQTSSHNEIEHHQQLQDPARLSFHPRGHRDDNLSRRLRPNHRPLLEEIHRRRAGIEHSPKDRVQDDLSSRGDVGRSPGGKETAKECRAGAYECALVGPTAHNFGIGDAFTLVGLQDCFYDQVPDSMRSLGMALYLSVIGVGSFLSSFFIFVVDQITENSGGSWIGKDLSTSRLDNFYWLLAAISVLNFCVYVVVARGYTYKNVDRTKVAVAYDSNGIELV